MAKKFYDIFPPGVKNIYSEDEKESSILLKKQPRQTQKPKPKLKQAPSFSSKKKLALFLVLTVLVAGGLAFFKLRSVNLTLWPQTEDFLKEHELTIVSNYQEINLKEKIIPGFLFEEEKELSQEFLATYIELKEEKAKGTIRVFNEDRGALSLVKETRFLSETNKTFICPDPIFVPGNSYIDIDVAAIEAGEDYNIGPSHFSIPGLMGTPRYFTTYGKSSEAMTGGIIKEIKKVTDEELEKGKNSLTEEIFLSLEKSLKEKISTQFILIEEVVSFQTEDISLPAEIGSENGKFNIALRGKIRALVFKKSDLENISKKLLLSDLPSDRRIFEESLSLTYNLTSVNFQNNQLKLGVAVSAKSFSKIDENLIKTRALNKEKDGLEEIILKSFPQISKIKIKLLPPWIKKTPSNIERIYIHWKFD